MCYIYNYSIRSVRSSYGAPLTQRASYLAQHSSLFGPDDTDYIVTNSITSLLIGLRCIPNCSNTNHCLANLAHSKRIKTWSICIVRVISGCTCTMYMYWFSLKHEIIVFCGLYKYYTILNV